MARDMHGCICWHGGALAWQGDACLFNHELITQFDRSGNPRNCAVSALLKRNAGAMYLVAGTFAYQYNNNSFFLMLDFRRWGPQTVPKRR